LKIGILGTGVVGNALGDAFIALGHEVKMGSRDAKNEKAVAWATQAGKAASTGTFADAAEFGEIVVLALLWTGAENALQLAGAKNLAGKLVLDATNPLKYEEGKTPALAIGFNDSGGEQIQRWLPDSKVVKVFNTVGAGHMFKPDFPGGPPTMFIAGNDAGAKKTVTSILKDFGWETVDTGSIEGSRLLEPLCILWVNYGFQTGTWNHAYKLLRK
jgi:predicted dinucleotide-binding enzyme